MVRPLAGKAFKMTARFHPQPGAILRCNVAYRLLQPGTSYALETRDSRLVCYLRDISQPMLTDDRHTTFMATWHVEEGLQSGALVIDEAAPDLCTCSACQALDAQPVRLHGIPGARQMTLMSEGAMRAANRREQAAEACALAPGDDGAYRRRPLPDQRGLEGLGLFDPTLVTAARQPELAL